MSRQRKRRTRAPSQSIWLICKTIDHLLAGKSGISIIPDLKEVPLWLLELLATLKEWVDLFVPKRAAWTAWKPYCEKTKG